MINWDGKESKERFGAAEAGKYSDTDVLRFLAKHQGTWSTWGKGYAMPTIKEAMPGASDSAQWRKARLLHRYGLIGGCTCGCRGDWEITDLGLACIGEQRTKPYSGYGQRSGSVKESELQHAIRLVHEGRLEIKSVRTEAGPGRIAEIKIEFGPKEIPRPE